MRIRTIKPEFFRHEDLFDAEEETGLPLRLAFVGLWCASDREGRFKWRPRTLKSEILPFDDVDFSRVLDALATRGFIVKYASETGKFGHIPSFTTHQVINNREKDSILPDPLNCKGFDACLTRGPRVDDAGKGEGKGREGKGKEQDSCPQADEKAELIFQEYPRKVKKPNAIKAIKKALKTNDWSFLLEKTKEYAKARKDEDSQFTPHPATWFNAQQFNDDPATWSSKRRESSTSMRKERILTPDKL